MRWQKVSSGSSIDVEFVQNATELALEEQPRDRLNTGEPTASNKSVQNLSNWQAHLYGGIFQAIEAMSQLPEDDDLHLDEEVASRALDVVAFLKENLRVPAPKLINQDGEAISLTWSGSGIKKFLTIAEDEVDLMLLSTNSFMKCEELLSENAHIPFERVAASLSAQVKSSSVDEF